jgi:hypothetical protein
MLCTSCKTPVPLSAAQCPVCGTATPVDLGATEVFTQLADQTELSTGREQGWSKPHSASDAIASDTISLRTGTILGGRYEILDGLGEGGF